MAITLTDGTTSKIKRYLSAYAETSKETIPEAFSDMAISMLVSKYVSLRHFPDSFDTDAITEDVENYFSDNAGFIASRIPTIYGRIGVEGEKMHQENGFTHQFASGDPLYGIFPDVVQFVGTV